MDIITTPQELGAVASVFWAWAVEFLPRLGSALLLLLVGFMVAKWAGRAVSGLAARTDRVDPTLRPLFAVVVRYSILIVVVVAALAQLGVQTASMLAAIGAAGLAIGLALQGTLANIAAGIMILWLRPFGAGDFVETSGVSGTVVEVGLFSTEIKTWDGIFKFVPNSQLWNVILTNYTRYPTRLLTINFSIDYESDIGEARRILEETARRHPRVLSEPAEPAAVPLTLGEYAVVVQLRAWTPVSEFGNVQWDLTQSGKAALQAAGIKLETHIVQLANGGTTAPGRLPAS